MLPRILGKSLARRKGRIAIAVVSVLMGAAVATALMAVSMGVEEQVSAEFRKYGANLVVVPRSDTIQVGFPGVHFGSVTEQGYIEEGDLWRILAIPWRTNIFGFAPFLYQVVSAQGSKGTQDLVLAGTYFDQEIQVLEPYAPQDPKVVTTGVSTINPWWRASGDWIDDPSDTISAMVGVNVASKLGLVIGDTVRVTNIPAPGSDVNATSVDLRVTGTIATSGSEDDQVFVNLHLAQDLSSRPGKVHTVQVSALCTDCPVNVFAKEIEEGIPYVEARTVKQLVSAEMGMLEKFEGMMVMVTGLAMAASVLGVTTTMTTSVIERRKEIGLMKSVGADRGRITLLFFAEATVIGVLGGVVGFVAGAVLAYFIGQSVFGTAVATSLILLPVAVAISVLVALLASIGPVRRALALEPAIVLRGD